jgi:hypothetical protein
MSKPIRVMVHIGAKIAGLDVIGGVHVITSSFFLFLIRNI